MGPLSQLPLSCPYRPPCPGCPRFGDDSLSPAGLASLAALRRHEAAEPLQIVTTDAPGYRHRARLSVRAFRGAPRLGLFELGSHDLVPIEGCLLHHPSLRLVLTRLEESLGGSGIAAYDEGSHRGLLRAVELAASRTTGKVQLVFVVNDRLTAPDLLRAQFEGVFDRLEQLGVVQSIFFNAQPERTNTLLGERFERVFGPPALEQETLGVKNFFPPGAFGQSNPALHERVVAELARWVPLGARVVEYHAGVGTIGLSIFKLRALSSLTQNEVGPPSLAGLRLGLEALGAPPEVRVVEGLAGASTDLIRRADVVIVDPPRKGLEESLLDALVRSAPGRLIYLSCGLPALVREAEVLAGAGILPRFLGAYSYFPFTDHIETLAVFERTS